MGKPLLIIKTEILSQKVVKPNDQPVAHDELLDLDLFLLQIQFCFFLVLSDFLVQENYAGQMANKAKTWQNLICLFRLNTVC